MNTFGTFAQQYQVNNTTNLKATITLIDIGDRQTSKLSLMKSISRIAALSAVWSAACGG